MELQNKLNEFTNAEFEEDLQVKFDSNKLDDLEEFEEADEEEIEEEVVEVIEEVDIGVKHSGFFGVKSKVGNWVRVTFYVIYYCYCLLAPVIRVSLF